MRDDHAHVMQVNLCKANTRGVTTMTNVCFAKAIKLGHDNGDRLGYHGGHAPMMEIVSVFKGWTTRLRMD